MELNEVQKIFLCDKLKTLNESKFRSSFKLKDKEMRYIQEKGLLKIEEHALEFIKKRLAPFPTPNDGKQTPMRGHPVFIAQHATATCCRSCLFKWHKIPKTRSLKDKEIRFIQALIIEWIKINCKEDNI